MKIRRHNQNVYKMEKLNCYNKMKDKRGIKEISLRVLNSKPFYAFMIFLILGISMVIAGDVIFQQGNFNIDTNVLFVNSTSHGVGIGTSNPDTLLSIQSPSGASGIKNLSSIKNAVGNTRFFFQYDIALSLNNSLDTSSYLGSLVKNSDTRRKMYPKMFLDFSFFDF